MTNDPTDQRDFGALLDALTAALLAEGESNVEYKREGGDFTHLYNASGEARAAVVAYVDADKLLIEAQDRALVASEADVQRLTAELAAAIKERDVAESQRAEALRQNVRQGIELGGEVEAERIRHQSTKDSLAGCTDKVVELVQKLDSERQRADGLRAELEACRTVYHECFRERDEIRAILKTACEERDELRAIVARLDPPRSVIQ